MPAIGCGARASILPFRRCSTAPATARRTWRGSRTGTRFFFISLCEQFKFGEAAYKKELGHLQREEFAVMFDYVWRRCVAGEPPLPET